MSRTAQPVRIASLHVYPVKSCHRIDLAEATLGARGLERDREWMVVTPEGRFLTQRTHPALARVRPTLEDGQLVLRHPTLSPLALPAAGDARWPLRQVRIFDDEVQARVADDVAGDWISAAAGVPAQLVRADAATLRQPATKWRGGHQAPVNFPDGFPLLVCNAASLADLGARMATPVPMTRFRPNLVLEGLAPWQEDEIEELRFGSVVLRLVKPCTRCSTTTVDQESGITSGDPVSVLKGFRFDRELRGATFGQNALATAGVGARLRVGDEGIARPRDA